MQVQVLSGALYFEAFRVTSRSALSFAAQDRQGMAVLQDRMYEVMLYGAGPRRGNGTEFYLKFFLV